eukprot:TRINITY_DN12247_c0_g1_i1.p1 TRINITY_DN12247_c0_g1~~TRINITY_DN12247_c0_g1_i1.p1  ORF type:complete len:515 (-),score=123.86 TRINITY_DN12247_c0_g1_i1:43-1587(-)
MTWATPRVSSARGRKTPGNFASRSTSSPALHRASSLYGGQRSFRESGRGLRESSCDVGPSLDPYGAGGDSEPELVGGRKASEERVREECRRLRLELDERRGEEQQLSQKVELLEGSLQQRTQQLDHLLDELKDAGKGASGDPEILERLTSAHSHAYRQRQAEGQERQGLLRERLAEVQQESERLIAQFRASDRRSSQSGSDRDSERRPSSARPKSSSGGSHRHTLGPGIPPSRPAPRNQDDGFVADFERSHRELLQKVEQISKQLHEERQARHDQASQSSAPASASPPACAPAGAGQFVEAPGPRGVVEGDRTGQFGYPPGSIATPSASWSSLAGKRIETPAGNHRQELEALREAEHAQRAAARRRSKAAVAAAGRAPLPEETLDRREESAAELRQALQAMHARCQHLEETSRAAEHRAAEAEAKAQEAEEAAQASSELAKAAEQRAWATAEAANELALQADLRHVEALESQLRMQKQLHHAQERCQVLQAIANQIARGQCDEGEALPASSEAT